MIIKKKARHGWHPLILSKRSRLLLKSFIRSLAEAKIISVSDYCQLNKYLSLWDE